jgi:flagellin
MTDTSMEEAAARLKSLQVQEQLGAMSLNIANSAPGRLSTLF